MQFNYIENELTLKLAINSVLVDGAYQKLNPYLQRAYMADDRKLTEIINTLQKKTMSQIGTLTCTFFS
jgi:hypothetical protein